MGDEVPVHLAEFVGALRGELRRAIAERDPELPLVVDSLTVELMVQTTRTTGAKGGISFWVMEAGAETNAQRGSTQRITLTLTPTDPHGSPILIMDED